MIQVTINLENEHLLKNNVEGMLDSLTEEQKSKIAEKARYSVSDMDFNAMLTNR